MASRRIAATVVAGAAVLLAAACSGSGSGPTGGGQAAPGGGNAAFTAYVDCLRRNGVTVTMPSGRPRVRPSGSPRPRPSGSAGSREFPGGGFFGKPPGVDDATWQKAQAACATLRPSFGPGAGRNNGAYQAYVNCLRDHGVRAGQGERLSSADPAVQKAMAVCRVLRPTARPSPSP
jgi:hypothetical protein